MTTQDESSVDETLENFDALHRDIVKHAKRAKAAKHLDFTKESSDNLYPLIQAMWETLHERFEHIEAAIGELGDMVEADVVVGVPQSLAEQVFALIALGDAMAATMDSLELDDVSKKRLAELTDAWKIAAPLVGNAVKQSAVEDDEDDEDDEEGEEGDEEGDEDDTEETPQSEGEDE